MLEIYANQLGEKFSSANNSHKFSRCNAASSLKCVNKFKRALSRGHGRLHHPELGRDDDEIMEGELKSSGVNVGHS